MNGRGNDQCLYRMRADLAKSTYTSITRETLVNRSRDTTSTNQKRRRERSLNNRQKETESL